MKKIIAMGAVLVGLLSPLPAVSQALLDSYVAVIGYDDLFNSKGVRLNQPWQILRQDRANYHRFGIRQQGDQGDSFFSRINNRAVMERMVMKGHINSRAARDIVSGNAVVLVRIYGSGNTGRYVKVTVVE